MVSTASVRRPTLKTDDGVLLDREHLQPWLGSQSKLSPGSPTEGSRFSLTFMKRWGGGVSYKSALDRAGYRGREQAPLHPADLLRSSVAAVCLLLTARGSSWSHGTCCGEPPWSWGKGWATTFPAAIAPGDGRFRVAIYKSKAKKET